MIKKDIKAIINAAGNGGISTRVAIPAEWARILGISKEDKELEIELTVNKEIIIRKKENNKMGCRKYEGMGNSECFKKCCFYCDDFELCIADRACCSKAERIMSGKACGFYIKRKEIKLG